MTQVIQWVFGFLSKRSTNMLMLLMLLFNYKSTCFTKHFQRNPSPIPMLPFRKKLWQSNQASRTKTVGSSSPFVWIIYPRIWCHFTFLCNTEIFKGFFLCNSGFSIGCFCLVPEKGGILYNVSKNPFPKNHGPCYRRVWICIAGLWDLQTTSFEIPWFLG